MNIIFSKKINLFKPRQEENTNYEPSARINYYYINDKDIGLGGRNYSYTKIKTLKTKRETLKLKN